MALAGGSQAPSQSLLGGAATTTAAGGGSRRPAVTAATADMLAASEEQHLVALAASTQPSQAPLGASGAAWQRSSRAGSPAPARGGGGGGDFFDPMDELDALLEMEQGEDGEEQRPAGGSQHRTPAAARPAPGAAGAAAASPAAEAAPAPTEQQQASPELALPQRPYVPPAKEVFRIRGASLACTSESGERVYCALEAPPAGGSRWEWFKLCCRAGWARGRWLPCTGGCPACWLGPRSGCPASLPAPQHAPAPPPRSWQADGRGGLAAPRPRRPALPAH